MEIPVPLLMLLALLVVVPFIWLSATRPANAFATLLVTTFLLPNEISVKLGDFPRLGPLRLAVAAFLVGLIIRQVFGTRGSIGIPRARPIGAVLGNFLVLVACAAFSIDV